MQKEHISNIKIEVKYPELKQDLGLLKRILLPEEYDTLKIIINAERPLSVRSIYVRNLVQKYIDYLESEKNLHIPPKLILEKNSTKTPFGYIKSAEVENHNFKQEMVQTYQNQINSLKIKLDKDLLSTKYIRELEKYMRTPKPKKDLEENQFWYIKEKIAFSSYHSILNAVNTLSSWNIVTFRSENSEKNASFYVILNPSFVNSYKNQFDKIT